MSDLETAPVVDPVVDPTLDEGDHERFAHYVRKEDIVRSAVEGTPVVALCGKVWVPHRNPDRYPVCPTCAEVLAQIQAAGSN